MKLTAVFAPRLWPLAVVAQRFRLNVDLER